MCMHTHFPDIYWVKVIKLIFWLYNVHVGTVDLAVANLHTGEDKKNDESGASSNGESSLLLINFR